MLSHYGLYQFTKELVRSENQPKPQDILSIGLKDLFMISFRNRDFFIISKKIWARRLQRVSVTRFTILSLLLGESDGECSYTHLWNWTLFNEEDRNSMIKKSRKTSHQRLDDEANVFWLIRIGVSQNLPELKESSYWAGDVVKNTAKSWNSRMNFHSVEIFPRDVNCRKRHHSGSTLLHMRACVIGSQSPTSTTLLTTGIEVWARNGPKNENKYLWIQLFRV